VLGFVPRSVAVVGIVGALSFGMPVAAQADTSPTVLKILGKVATFIGASGIGVVAAGPEAIAAEGFGCAASLPLCAAVAAATVGLALYATQDTWVPWLQGDFGATSPGGTTGTGVGGCTRIAWNTQYYPNIGLVDGIGAGYITAYTVTSPANCTEGMWMGGHQQLANGSIAVVNVSMAGKIIQSDAPVGTEIWGWAGPSLPAGAKWLDLDVLAGSGGELHWSAGGAPITDANTTTSMQVNCVNPDGSTYSVTSAVPLAGDLVKVPTCTGAAGDLGGAHGYCATLSAGATGGAMVEQSSNCPAVGSDAALYPNCESAGCAYMVIVDGIPCTVGRPGCVDWAATYQGSPGRVGCRYGEYAVKVSSCFFLERVYESVGLPVDGTLANTDGNPATFTGPEPAPNPQPQPQPQPIPNGAPGGDPGTLPGGGTAPLPSPTGTATTNGDCWAGGAFSWNPVDWVLRPVECALAWAFVPSAAAVSGPIADFKTTWNSKPPGSLIVGATTVFASIGNGWDGGCSGAASASFSRPEDGHPLQLPCTPSGGGSGTVPYTAMQIALIVATLIYLWHMVAAGISAQATGAGD